MRIIHFLGNDVYINNLRFTPISESLMDRRSTSIYFNCIWYFFVFLKIRTFVGGNASISYINLIDIHNFFSSKKNIRNPFAIHNVRELHFNKILIIKIGFLFQFTLSSNQEQRHITQNTKVLPTNIRSLPFL